MWLDINLGLRKSIKITVLWYCWKRNKTYNATGKHSQTYNATGKHSQTYNVTGKLSQTYNVTGKHSQCITGFTVCAQVDAQ